MSGLHSDIVLKVLANAARLPRVTTEGIDAKTFPTRVKRFRPGTDHRYPIQELSSVP
jgi:hypothetical protein